MLRGNMKVVFLSNYYSYHQAPFSEAMYRLTNGSHRFVSTTEMGEKRRRMGWEENRPHFVGQYKDDPQKYQRLIDEADVVVFGSAPYSLLKNRLKRNQLTFVYSERVYKKPCPLWQIPLRAVKYWWKWGRHKNVYLLCASAYTAPDYAMTGTFNGKSYKWGYFPETKEYDLETLFARKLENKNPSLLWAGRLINWKHPDDAVALARSLKEKGYSFRLDIIGNGIMEAVLQESIVRYGLQDCVHMLGAMSTEQVREHMEQADIYLFTSDRNEGWGAVLNESMNSGCAVVANQEIGAVPYLLKTGENGFSYQTVEEMELYVEQLLQDNELRCKFGKAAYYSITEQWNAENAAKRILILAEELQKNKSCTFFDEGPCSKA